MEGRIFLTGIPGAVRGGDRVSGRLPGTPVQRLAAIAPGDGICAAHVTAPSLVHIRNTAINTAAGTTTTESGGISA
jgi:hypothetical protein